MSFNLRTQTKIKVAEYYHEGWMLKHVEIRYLYTRPGDQTDNHPGDDPELKIVSILAWPNDDRRKDSINLTEYVSDKFRQHLADGLLDDELNKRF